MCRPQVGLGECIFWGDRWKGCGLEGGFSTPGFSHPENGYILGFFLNLASGGDLDSIHVQLVKGFTRSNGLRNQVFPEKVSLMFSHQAMPKFARVASIDFHTLQPSEWMGATGAVGI